MLFSPGIRQYKRNNDQYNKDYLKDKSGQIWILHQEKEHRCAQYIMKNGDQKPKPFDIVFRPFLRRRRIVSGDKAIRLAAKINGAHQKQKSGYGNHPDHYSEDNHNPPNLQMQVLHWFRFGRIHQIM